MPTSSSQKCLEAIVAREYFPMLWSKVVPRSACNAKPHVIRHNLSGPLQPLPRAMAASFFSGKQNKRAWAFRGPGLRGSGRLGRRGGGARRPAHGAAQLEEQRGDDEAQQGLGQPRGAGRHVWGPGGRPRSPGGGRRRRRDPAGGGGVGGGLADWHQRGIGSRGGLGRGVDVCGEVGLGVSGTPDV